ncbi:hypothetical protein L249_7904 [Ophiocordyceps polyrhachis-furcata BCC 54312]|uniref:Uncharacterized protein n=1 Tax=Ophiocordyceps polyrhachis-furcata BCC 54312 TaxID=1330021 RepID=A0A367LHQ0_9HYPO|nr:hypothetical protein L249_7904 [Ophiocordyceps polyrhachis-furcata BCC 54312]
MEKMRSMRSERSGSDAVLSDWEVQETAYTLGAESGPANEKRSRFSLAKWLRSLRFESIVSSARPDGSDVLWAWA